MSHRPMNMTLGVSVTSIFDSNLFPQPAPSPLMVTLEARHQDLQLGFDTNEPFGTDYFVKVKGNNTPFIIVSTRSRTRYTLLVGIGAISGETVQVYRVGLNGEVHSDPKNWHKMTLVRGNRGQIQAREGWDS